MDGQAEILASRFSRMREMREEIARLHTENLRLRGEMEACERHFSLALMAALDLVALPDDGIFIIVDGWNIALGGQRRRTPKMLRELALKYLALHKNDFVWIVWDGPDEGGSQRDRLRMSWTGGVGKQRADRFICDFIRMANWRGCAKRIRLLSSDKELLSNVKRLLKRLKS